MGAWDSLSGKWTSGGSNPEFLKQRTLRFLPTNETSEQRSEGFSDPRETWGHIVAQYTQRQIKNADDRFFAFSGIMETHRRLYDRKFVVGLWRERLCEELVSWSPKHPMSSINVGGPSWSWLYTDWWTSDNWIPFHQTSINTFSDASMEVQHIDDEITTSAKLTLFGLILQNLPLINLLYHLHEFPKTTISSPWANARLDQAYDESLGCDCNPSQAFANVPRIGFLAEKYAKDCQAYHIVSQTTPNILALFAGVAYSDFPEEQFEWHFLLIQPTNTVDDNSENPQYHRVGTLHILEERIVDVVATIMAELKAQEKETIVLV